MASNKKDTLLTAVSGAAGEHYVTAELLRRYYSAAMLYSNSKEFDILAIDQLPGDTYGRQLAIQVKTSQKKGLTWQLGDREPYYSENAYYVFVTILGDAQPEYYIVPSHFVHDRAEERHNTPTRTGTPRSDNRKFVLKEAERELFHNKWENFRNIGAVSPSALGKNEMHEQQPQADAALVEELTAKFLERLR